eukprot:TRINITY_DN61426_c0_g1_i1.p1 TRINITY_DN61426_c0_g1~~TRINITY_DN61426_c0_g1_i1.p1  ORF type:complete len:552 (+),score=96.21 TRINITY_DN61426_c0_g1_i1:111-1766(+)
MAASALTLEELRAELDRFAQSFVHEELSSRLDTLQDRIVSEFRRSLNSPSDPDVSQASSQPWKRARCDVELQVSRKSCAKLMPEAHHGMPSPRSSPLNSARALEQAPFESSYMRDGNGVAYSDLHGKKGNGRQRHMMEMYNPPVRSSCLDKIRGGAHDLVGSTWFENASASIVLLNAAWIGFQTDHVARQWSQEVPEWFHWMDWAFCVLASIEVFTRMVAQGCGFFYDHGWKWNWFDLVVVITQIVDLVMSTVVAGARHSQLSGLRIIKLVRILRIARIATVFPELHVLISSIVDSLYSLVWTLVLIVSFLYAIAIFITQAVNEHKILMGSEYMEEHEESIIEFYGTLDQTMVALYMIISEGIHWSELMDPLAAHISPWMRLLFVIFVGFQLFAMMNVITACFVDNAMKIAAKAEKDEILDSLWHMLQTGHSGHTGAHCKEHPDIEITLDSFQDCYHAEAMTRFLELVGAQGESANRIFETIDQDGDGSLTAHEFLEDIAKLIGPARAMQMAMFHRDMREMIKCTQDSLLEALEKLTMVLEVKECATGESR